MSATLSPSKETPYGIARVCRAWEVPRSSFYDWRRLQAMPAEDRPVPLKRGPKAERSVDGFAELLRALLRDTEAEAGITGEGYRKVHARLRFAGTRVGRERTLRVMREHGLLAPTRTGRRRGPRVHHGTVTTDRPDLMWGTDATRIATRLDGDACAPCAVAARPPAVGACPSSLRPSVPPACGLPGGSGMNAARPKAPDRPPGLALLGRTPGGSDTPSCHTPGPIEPRWRALVRGEARLCGP